MRFEFRPTKTTKTFFVVEQLVEHEWRLIDSIHPTQSTFDSEQLANKQAFNLSKILGDKFRVVRVLKTINTSYDVDVCTEF